MASRCITTDVERANRFCSCTVEWESGDDWRYIFASDPPGYSVIVPDLRGHGRSTSPAQAFTFKACADDIRGLLDQLHIERVKAVGMSMGAKTLLHLATADPSRVDAMVLVSATPRFPIRCGPRPNNSLGRRSNDSQPLSGTHFAPATSTEMSRLRGCTEMTRSFASERRRHGVTAASLGTITARTLIVHGDRDPLYPVELAIELYAG